MYHINSKGGAAMKVNQYFDYFYFYYFVQGCPSL